MEGSNYNFADYRSTYDITRMPEVTTSRSQMLPQTRPVYSSRCYDSDRAKDNVVMFSAGAGVGALAACAAMFIFGHGR